MTNKQPKKLKNLRLKLFMLWLKEEDNQLTIIIVLYFICILVAIFYGGACLNAKQLLFGPPILNIIFFIAVFGYFIYLILSLILDKIKGR